MCLTWDQPHGRRAARCIFVSALSVGSGDGSSRLPSCVCLEKEKVMLSFKSCLVLSRG